MGQVTLPVLNRKGFSDVWEYQWNVTQSFNTNTNEDEFISTFFTKFFRNWLSYNHVKFYQHGGVTYTKKSRKNKFFTYSDEFNSEEIFKTLKFIKNRKFPYYISRLFILKYDGWVVLYMYFYVPRSWYKKFEKKQIKKYNYNYVIDIYNYHIQKSRLISANS